MLLKIYPLNVTPSDQVHVDRSALWVRGLRHRGEQPRPGGRGAADRLTRIRQRPLLTCHGLPFSFLSVHAIHLLDYVSRLLPLKRELKPLILKGFVFLHYVFLLYFLYPFPVYSKCYHPPRRISLYPVVYWSKCLILSFPDLKLSPLSVNLLYHKIKSKRESFS